MGPYRQHKHDIKRVNRPTDLSTYSFSTFKSILRIDILNSDLCRHYQCEKSNKVTKRMLPLTNPYSSCSSRSQIYNVRQQHTKRTNAIAVAQYNKKERLGNVKNCWEEEGSVFCWKEQNDRVIKQTIV